MDIKILQKVKNGDEEAQKVLFAKTYQKAFFTAKGFLGIDQDAEDAVQNAYIKMFSKLSSLEDLEKFEPWFNRIVINSAKDLAKRNNPVLFSSLSNDDEDLDFEDSLENTNQSLEPETVQEKEEIVRIIGGILENLSEEQRLCIQLYYFNNLKIREIAEIMELSENTVKSRLRLAKNKIEKEVEIAEKREGIKLHAIPVLPVFFGQKAISTGVNWSVFNTATATIVETTAATVGINAATAVATKTGVGIGAKVVASVAAIAVVIGGGIGIKFAVDNNIQETTPPAIAETATSQIEEEEIVFISEEEVEDKFWEAYDFYKNYFMGPVNFKAQSYDEWLLEDEDVERIDGEFYRETNFEDYDSFVEQVRCYFDKDTADEYLRLSGARNYNDKVYLYAISGAGDPFNIETCSVEKFEDYYNITFDIINGDKSYAKNMKCAYDNGTWVFDECNFRDIEGWK